MTTYHTQFVAYLVEGSRLTGEISELRMFWSSLRGRVGIFHNAGEGGIGHSISTFASTLETMCEEAESVGIALKMGDVAPHLR